MGWLWGSTSDSKENTSKSYENSYESESSYDISPATSISDTLHSGFDGELAHGSAAAGDADLQKFLLHEQQKAQLQAMIHKINDICWDTCVISPENRISSRNETCISNCVERFIDSSLFITNRFAQLLSKSGGS